MSSTAKKVLCGYPIGVVLICWHSLTLGIDYTIWLSTAPSYFKDILNHSGEYNSDPNATYDLADDSSAAFSIAQAVWAGGQLAGCMASAPLPKFLGYRWSFVLLVFLSVCGNIMYSVAGIIGGDGGHALAIVGKGIVGFGDGSVALGLGYIPIALFKDRKRMVTAMVNYRALMALGMMIGGGVAIALEYIEIPELMGSDGYARIFSGGDLVGWAQACIFLPSCFLGCCAFDNAKPPTAKGKGGKTKVCTPYFTKKSCFWLFLVFSYGLTGSLATYFLPVFPYCPGFCNDLASNATLTAANFISYTTVGAFTAGFIGAMFNSVSSQVKSCKLTGLNILRIACIFVTISMGLMYGGYRTFDEDASTICTGQILFMVGICLYFLASTSLSAGMAPVFKEVIPKQSLSAMMPLYKICLDGGKIVGPLYSDWASTDSSDEWETRADIAFIPSVVMYVLISLAIYALGTYLSTPDIKVLKKPLMKQEAPLKTAEMTAFAQSPIRNQSSDQRYSDNSYANQRTAGSGNYPVKASTSGYDLYNGNSMSYSQISDAKNIDSVKVSLVI